MPPPKLSEKISLYDLFPNVDFNLIPSRLELDEPPCSSNDDYDVYFPDPVFDTLNMPCCIQHIGVLYHIPNQVVLAEPVCFNLNQNFSFTLASNIPPETPPIQHNGHTIDTNDEPSRLNICGTGKRRSRTRVADASIVALSWNAPKSDIYWIWIGLGLTLNHLLVKLCAYYLNITQKIKTYTDALNAWGSESSECTTGDKVDNPLEVIRQPRRRATQVTPFPGTHTGELREEPTSDLVRQQRPLTIPTAILERQEGMSHSLDEMCEKY